MPPFVTVTMPASAILADRIEPLTSNVPPIVSVPKTAFEPFVIASEVSSVVPLEVMSDAESVVSPPFTRFAVSFVPVRDTFPFTVRSPKEESSAFVMVRESSVVAPVEVTAPAFVTIMSAPDTTCPLSVVLSSRIVPSDVIASSTIVPSFASRLATCAVLPFTDA